MACAQVEEFWRLYVHLRRPVDERPTVCDYHVFRNGIRPMWEDEANVRSRLGRGGRRRGAEGGGAWVEPACPHLDG
jgi:hypothetical protein